MGATTAFSATQSAEALNYMALAGYSAEDSMTMLPNVLNLAAAGGMDLAAASDMITDSQTALGISFDQTTVLVDQMAKTASTTNTSVAQLGDAILKVGGNAKNLSGGTNELNAVLGVLADNGIKGTEAGTHLRNIMLAMNPTTDAAIAAFNQLGVTAYDSQGNLRSLDSVFGDLGAAMDGMSAEERTKILSDIFNKTDLASVNALLSTSADRWDEVYGAIENAADAASIMAATQLDNLAGDVTLFKSALEGLEIEISDQISPALRDFVQFGTESLGTLNEALTSGGLDGMASALGGVLADGLLVLSDYASSFLDIVFTISDGLFEGLQANAPALGEAGANLISQLVSGFARYYGQFWTTGAVLLLNFMQGMVANAPTILATIVQVALQMLQGIATFAPTFASLGAQLLVQLALGLAQAAPALIVASLNAVLSVAQAILSQAPQADFEDNWTWNTSLTGTYTGVKYQYKHTTKDKTFSVTVGEGDRWLTCDDPSDNQTEATLIALAKLNNANKNTTTMKITMRASIRIMATDTVEIKGLGQLDGKYFVEQITTSVGESTKMELSLRRVEKRFVKQAEPAKPVKVASSNPEKKTEDSKGAFKKGDRVRVVKGAKTYNGIQLASFVYTTVYTVIQVGGKGLPADRIVIGINGVVTAAVKASNLYRA